MVENDVSEQGGAGATLLAPLPQSDARNLAAGCRGSHDTRELTEDSGAQAQGSPFTSQGDVEKAVFDIIERLLDVALGDGTGNTPLVSFLEQKPDRLGYLPNLFPGEEALHVACPRRQNARDSASGGSHVPLLENTDKGEAAPARQWSDEQLPP